MVEESKINLSSLSLEALSGVIECYPWFGGARKEMCRRMSGLGNGAWSEESYAEAAVFVPSREIIYRELKKGSEVNYSDKNVSSLIEKYFNPVKTEEEKTPKILLVGGDYFSKSQYESVRRSEDNIFSTFATKAREEGYSETPMADLSDFCTEAIAEIFVEQEHFDEAINIYSKLSLRYPEKSAYFAALIDKIKNR